MEIAGQIAVITGGGSGMGAETAAHLARLGARVAILDHDAKAGRAVAERVDGFAIACDVSQEIEVESAFLKIADDLGSPRLCINSAGIAPAQRIVGKQGCMPLHDFEKVIQVNLIGTFNVMRIAAGIMSKLEPIGSEQERGVIINTASIAAYEGQIGQAAYSASKGGVCSLTLPAARELSQFSIRVMTIAPGLINTPLFENIPQNVKDHLISDVVFPRRLGNPTEFASLVQHVIENTYLNGSVIRLDGGLRMT